MPAPADEPIGLLLVRIAKSVNRAFDDALSAVGGSRPTWLILLALKREPRKTQADLAKAVGVRSPTLTHHLDGLEKRGLVTRRRDPDNRRVQVVELTAEGDQLFHRLREAAVEHDRRLRHGLDDGDLRRLRELVTRLGENVGALTADLP